MAESRPAPDAFEVRLTREELTRLATRLDHLAAIFRRQSDAGPVRFGAIVLQAVADGRLTVSEEPCEATAMSITKHLRGPL